MAKHLTKQEDGLGKSEFPITEFTRKHWFSRNDEKALVYILQSGNLYGTERMALATLQALDEYIVRVVIAPAPTKSGAGSVADTAKANGYKPIIFATKFDLLKALIPLFFQFRSVDIIGNGVSQGFTCYVLSKLLRVQMRQLHIVHGGTEDQHAYGTKFHLNRLPIRLIAVSNFVEAKLVRHGVRASSIDVIENFVSDAQFACARHRASYLNCAPRLGGGSRVKVAIVSRIDPIKRIDLLIESLEQGGLESFEFDVYGTGIELQTLRARAAPLSNICFHGFVDDVQHRLTKADFLLHLCPDEPFGLAILEGFMAGVVAIVPAAGGAGGIVEDGITGFKFEPNSSVDLTRILFEATTSTPERLQGLADEASRRLHSRFSQRQGAVRYRASFASLLH